MNEALSEAEKRSREGLCFSCGKAAGSLYLEDRSWVCRHCRGREDGELAYLKVMGSENPMDPKGSTAHVKDIKDRRWHPTENRMFYHSKEKPKSYYFPK